jgi:transcriptional regulator with XRE-family HTH domain
LPLAEIKEKEKMIDVGEMVRACRDREHLTLEEVSLRCGVHPATISKIEHSTNCKVDTLEKILNAMGYELEIVPMK